MSKSKELNELKKRYENLTEEIRELSEEELKEVTGGVTDEDEEPIVWELWDVNKSSGRARIPHEFL